MTRLLSGLFPLLVCFSAFAEDVKDAPIPTTMNVVGIAIFLVLFFGSCIGFFGYMWWTHKQDQKE